MRQVADTPQPVMDKTPKRGMSRPEFMRSSTFRVAITISAAFALFIILLFGFIYWRTSEYLTTRSDRMIRQQIRAIASLSEDRRSDAIGINLKQDSRGVQFAGLFDAEGRRIIGNVAHVPPALKPDDMVRSTMVVTEDAGQITPVIRAIVGKLSNGDLLLIGRNVDEAQEIAMIVGQALMFGLLPAFLLSLAAGILLSIRAQRRVADVNRQVQLIVAGDLSERLPCQGIDDPFSRLAGIVNGMLDEMEALIHALAGVGNDIAHDVRTPLTRARLILERGRNNANTLQDLQDVTDKAIVNIDQTLAITTALLRLAEIENTQRTAGFGEVLLGELVREVGDLYEPIAENKRITLSIQCPQEIVIRGDRDLLIEAVANLVDNAVKFTPEGGYVDLTVEKENKEGIIRIKDSGPGIASDEQNAVLRRFYRSEKMRSTPGVGLGMNLVAAIVKLHKFRFTIHSGHGCVVEIGFPLPTIAH